MRIGIIRADLPGPVFLADLEPVSRRNFSTEPPGQEVYVARPTTTEVETVLSNSSVGAGAAIEGSDLTATLGGAGVVIDGTHNILKVRTSATASYTTCTIASATYTTLPTLLAAVNAALLGTGITARQGTGTGLPLALESDTRGVSSYLGVDSVVGGSNALATLGLGATAIVRTMPTAATIITALNPVGGTLDVSVTTINTVGSSTSSTAFAYIPTSRGTHEALADAIAPQFLETTVALDSYLVGYIAALRSASFNPDSRQGLVAGAAIQVVQDDGTSAMTVTLPTITTATLGTPSAGDVTIAGTGLGNSELLETVVQFSGDVSKSLNQSQIVAAGGSVSATAVVVPASLIPGAVTTTTSAKVKVRSRASAASALV